jgi:uncharacterized membrane protein YdjX (TVP38/TMEM64 family)
MGAQEEQSRFLRWPLIRLAVLCLLIAALFAFWRFSPLGEFSDPEHLGALLDHLSASPWAGPIVVVGFVLGSFVVFPVSVMIAATGIALGPRDGLVWASTGAFVAATINYATARLLPNHLFDLWVGTWVRRLGRRFEERGIVSVMVARTIPIAPFTLINIVAGAASIRLRDFLVGTVLGMGPVIAALTILGDRLRDAWEAPTAWNMASLGLAIVAWFAIGFSLQSLSNRLVSVR